MRRWLWIAGWLAASAGCGGGEETASLARLEARIAAEAQGRCLRDDECGALPLGAKACGGPAFFVPYSVRDDTSLLEDLAARHRALSRAALETAEVVGDCRVAVAPPVRCRAGRCVLVAAESKAAARP